MIVNDFVQNIYPTAITSQLLLLPEKFRELQIDLLVVLLCGHHIYVFTIESLKILDPLLRF
jgi:hypothetical protein